jgi:hypothetical protein
MRSWPGARRFRSQSPFGTLGRTTLPEPIFIVELAVGNYCRHHLSGRTTGPASPSVSPRLWGSDRFCGPFVWRRSAGRPRYLSQVEEMPPSPTPASPNLGPRALIHRICQTSDSLVPSMKLSSEVLEESVTLSICAVSHGINLWKLLFIVVV